jgi:4-amino-4-deoxy-L-arabinose transferase-like glycosyltransferase
VDITDVDLVEQNLERPAVPRGAAQSRRRRRWLVPLAILVLSFAALAPGLARRPFTNSMENIVVGSALEARRDGHWLVPTLEGEVRTRKPPLAVWVAAAGVRPATVAALNDADPARRAAAYERFTWEVRWSALLCSSLALVALYDLGRTVGGPLAGVLAPAIAATTLLLLEYARIASYDTQLTLWVTVCNAFLARAVLRRQYRLGFLGAGVAGGLALMSKGPVALLETIVPVVLFVMWRRFAFGQRLVSHRGPRTAAPVVAGIALAAAVGLPWYGLMVWTHPRIGETWFGEVTRTNAADPRPDPWVVNLKILSVLIPWVVWVAAGIVLGALAMGRRPPTAPHGALRRRLVFAVFLFVIPFAVMTCFRERKQRYWQPLAAPASVVAAVGLVNVTRRHRGVGEHPLARPLAALHWCVAGGWVLSVPLYGAFKAKTFDGQPWFSTGAAAGFLLVGAAIVGAAIYRLHRRGPEAGALVLFTVLGMLLADALWQSRDLRSPGGRSEMRPVAEAVWASYPDARVFGDGVTTTNVPLDLSIYLDRPVRPTAELPRGVSDRPLVLMVFQRSGDPAPQPPDERWHLLATAERGKNRWHAFALPAAQAR